MLKQLPTDLWYVLFVCLMVVLYGLYTGECTPRLLGAVLLGAGWSVRAWCRVLLEEVGVGGALLVYALKPKQYVTTGPYRLHNHPMYVGSVALFAGVGMMLTNRWEAGVVVALGVLPHYVWRAVVESNIRG